VCKHASMSRTTLLVLVALGAGLVGFGLSATAERLDDAGARPRPTVAASPQSTAVEWRETYGTQGQKLVFSVASLEVMPGGWRARVSLDNGTSVPFEVGDPRHSAYRSFGLMLFGSGDHDELEARNAEGTLPAVRRAVAYRPSLPGILEPGKSWSGTISAPGALVADSWVRVVFGPLVSVGEPPARLDDNVVWISDVAYRLR
jgi:hypothetical protein